MKKMYMMLLLSMASMLQGMEQPTVNVLSKDFFWLHAVPYLLYKEGPQVASEAIKASSCSDKDTSAVFKTSSLSSQLINLFQRYLFYNNFNKKEVLDSLFPVLFSNVQEVKALYVKDSVTIEAFVETLKSCAQSKDWSPALAQLEVIGKESRLVLQLNNAYWDVNPYIRTTVLSYALLLNAPKELIQSLINSGAPLTNLSPKVLPPLLIMALKTTGTVTIDPLDVLSEKVVSVISDEVVDRIYVKELITILCASGAQIQDIFDNSSKGDPFLNSLSALEWAILTHDKDLLGHLLLQQKDRRQRKPLLFSCALVAAARTFIFDQIKPSRTDIQRLAGEECFKLLLENSKNSVSELFCASSDIISLLQHIPGIKTDQLAEEVAGTITTLLSLFIEYRVDINHLIDKRTILDRAQDEGWHETIIDFLIEKGARNGSCEFTQEEIKNQTFSKVL